MCTYEDVHLGYGLVMGDEIEYPTHRGILILNWRGNSRPNTLFIKVNVVKFEEEKIFIKI